MVIYHHKNCNPQLQGRPHTLARAILSLYYFVFEFGMYGSLPGFELIYPGPKVVTLPVCYTPLTSLVFLVKAFISLSTSLVYVCLVKKGLLGVTSIVAPLIGQIVYYLS